MGRLNDLDPMLRNILLGYPHAGPRNTECPKRMSHGVRNAGCGTSDPWLVLFPVDRITLLGNLCQHLPQCRFHRSRSFRAASQTPLQDDVVDLLVRQRREDRLAHAA